MTAAGVALLEAEELDLGLDAFDESHCDGRGCVTRVKRKRSSVGEKKPERSEGSYRESFVGGCVGREFGDE